MNVKAGDLAYLIRGSHGANGIPQIVEVLSRAIDHPTFGPLWTCRSRRPLKYQDDITGNIGWSTVTEAADAWLRPISGVPITEDQIDEARI
jgi:hypothetical protein